MAWHRVDYGEKPGQEHLHRNHRKTWDELTPEQRRLVLLDADVLEAHWRRDRAAEGVGISEK